MHSLNRNLREPIEADGALQYRAVSPLVSSPPALVSSNGRQPPVLLPLAESLFFGGDAFNFDLCWQVTVLREELSCIIGVSKVRTAAAGRPPDELETIS